MFTGIVTDIGDVVAVEERAQGLRRLTIACGYDPASIAIGASVCCSGVCMTAIATGKNTFSVDAAAETLKVTTVGRWRTGTRVNLERSLKMGDELGGHLVSGHVDGLAELTVREDMTDMARLTLRVPNPLARFIAQKGSIALDGVSLTVNWVEGARFGVMLIPHTLGVTTLGAIASGRELNLEVDLVARYVARLLEADGVSRVRTGAVGKLG